MRADEQIRNQATLPIMSGLDPTKIHFLELSVRLLG